MRMLGCSANDRAASIPLPRTCSHTCRPGGGSRVWSVPRVCRLYCRSPRPLLPVLSESDAQLCFEHGDAACRLHSARHAVPRHRAEKFCKLFRGRHAANVSRSVRRSPRQTRMQSRCCDAGSAQNLLHHVAKNVREQKVAVRTTAAVIFDRRTSRSRCCRVRGLMPLSFSR